MGSQDHQPTLREAAAALDENRTSDAERACRAVIEAAPQAFAAHALLGLALRRQGRLEEAERHLRIAVEIAPGHAGAWNSLGGTLLAAGRWLEASACFERATTLSPGLGEAWLNLASAQRRCGATGAAESSLLRASHLMGETAGVLHLRGLLAQDGERPEAALAAFDTAMARYPESPRLAHDRAIVLARLGRHDEALAGLDRARALGLDSADLHYNRGNALQSLGRLAEARIAYGEAVRQDPVHRLALYDLARLIWRSGSDDFAAPLQDAATRAPGSPVALEILGHLAWRAEQWDRSAEAFRAALDRAPGRADLLAGLGRALTRLGSLDLALAVLGDAVGRAPAVAEYRTDRAIACLAAGRLAEAEEEAESACARVSLDQHALAVRGAVWQARGDPRAAALNDYARLVSVVMLDPPPGWASLDAFNAKLTDTLRGWHHDTRAPVDQTLRHGTQTLGNLFERRHPVIDSLKQALARAIDRHLEQLPVDGTHPLLSRRSGRWRFTDAWSSRLHQAGFHTDHVHPHGWISCVYYVAVPVACRDPERRQGWLRFGHPDLPPGAWSRDWRHGPMIEPEPGRLVLFPSYCWHGTTPLEHPGERLTVAFDIQPL